MNFKDTKFLKTLEPKVFWPPFSLLISALCFSLINPSFFQTVVNNANDWILDWFGWLFSYTSFFMVVLCLGVLVSPISNHRIGGEHATPLMSRYRWFSIILCTSVAVGILFWGTAEPLFHISAPPNRLQAAQPSQLHDFAMSTMYMHWSFTPYAIYCIPALLFALAYYNKNRPFSLGSMLFPIQKSRREKLGTLINILCLFALVAGMAASLGAGLLSISGGLSRYFDFPPNAITLGVIAVTIVATFTVSAASGLLKGIKWLSTLNMVIFIFLVGFVFFNGPSNDILRKAVSGAGYYLSHFLEHSLSLGTYDDHSWTSSWTTFYWANWMAWAPVTALFLGRLAYGRTVREFMLFNWLLPALFSMLWMSVFSGTVLSQEEHGANLITLLNTQGAKSIIYEMIQVFPFSELVSGLFIVTMFISYVTAADSNTMAMSGLSAKGISPENPEPPAGIKYLWGIVVGLVAWVMVSYSGIDGVKMLSNLGGLPALFLLIASCAAMITLLLRKGLE